MAERHAGRVSAVFTTDADLQVWPLTASGVHSNLHQRPHSLGVDRREWVVGQHALIDIAPEELALGVVTTEAKDHLR